MVSNNAFGNASSKIINFTLWDQVNHSPSRYDIWKVLNGLTNATEINVYMNIKEVPSRAFGRLLKLEKLTIASFNKLTIRSNGFKSLDNLSSLTLHTDFESVESSAFAFDKSTPKMAIIFWSTFLGKFSSKAFSGLKRPTNVGFVYMKLNFIPKDAFKSVLDNKNNIVLFESTINCTNCENYWMIRDGRDKQVINAYCTGDFSKQTNLFSSKIKSNLKSKCKNDGFGNNQYNTFYICLFVFINTLVMNIKLT